MFKKNPYYGWLLLCALLLLSSTAYYYITIEKRAPLELASQLAADIERRDTSFESFAKKIDSYDLSFENNLSKKHVPDDFYIYVYDSSQLVYWTDNTAMPDSVMALHALDNSIQDFSGKTFLLRRLSGVGQKGRETVIALIPIFIGYNFSNEYLSSYYKVSRDVPVSSVILNRYTKGSFPIRSIEGKTLFFIKIDTTNIPPYIPDTFLIILFFGAVLAFCIWIHLSMVYIYKFSLGARSLFLLIIVLTAFRAIFYLYHPFQITNLRLFSPELYASSGLHPSLGDVIINQVLALWVLLFIILEMDFRKDISAVLTGKWRIPILIIALIAPIAIIKWMYSILRSIVIDSNISFDIGHSNSFTWDSIAGLVTISLVLAVFGLLIYVVGIVLSIGIPKRLTKYLALTLINIIIAIGLYKHDTNLYIIFSIWLILSYVLLDYEVLRLSINLFSPKMLLLIIYLCLSGTFLLRKIFEVKEINSRIAYAGRFETEKDPLTEYIFNNISQNIVRDSEIFSFLRSPNEHDRLLLEKKFSTSYFNDRFGRYNAVTYIYNSNGLPLYNKDNIPLSFWDRSLTEFTPTSTPYLFYNDKAKDAHYYLAQIPLSLNDSEGSTLIVDLSLRRSGIENVYPNLLLPGNIGINKSSNDYSYAVYINNVLVDQTNDYPFPININKNDNNKRYGYTITNSGAFSVLKYRFNDSKTIVVVHRRQIISELFTMFSYLFGIFIIISLVTVGIRLAVSQFYIANRPVIRILNMSLRKRIQFSIQLVVLGSFLLIGVLAIIFNIVRNEENSNVRIQTIAFTIARSIQNFIQSNPSGTQHDLDSNLFKTYLADLANTQQIDLNVYDTNGKLLSTSQEDIYRKDLFAPLIQPKAFEKLVKTKEFQIVQGEKIGKLAYLSCYLPLLNVNNRVVGYVNVPYFTSHKELTYQISAIIVGLINLFTITFLLSSLLAHIIALHITKSFDLIILQFSRLSLSERNELINWPYNDEIGLLVNEYNKMVRKVEENVAILAENERDTAWRGMAQQVAHEIKNPLTPIKLQIQHLQSAVNRGQVPNIKELVNKVTDVIVEQIDSLADIATNFYLYASMPPDEPERLNITEVLSRSIKLFANDPRGSIEFVNKSKNDLFINIDHNQIIRVFNNILQNAFQALFEDSQGRIIVSLKQEDENVNIQISDNGKGINEEVKQNIFRPYFTTKNSGTGLGLALTKKIIENWKGKISFISEKDKGTVFTIILPLSMSEG